MFKNNLRIFSCVLHQIFRQQRNVPVIFFATVHLEDDEEKTEKQNQLSRRLENLKIGKAYLKKHPELMNIAPSVLKNNIDELRELKFDPDAVVKMLMQDQAVIQKMLIVCKKDLTTNGQHRVDLLSQQLNVPQEVVCSKILKYNFVLTLSFTRLKEILKLLLDNNVKPMYIMNDIWVLRCKKEVLEKRFERIKNAEVDVIKPWMGRCENSVFEGFLNRVSTKQKVIGDLTLEEYISHRLGRSPTEIMEIMKREPQLQRTSIIKMKKILDFLLFSGFKVEQILAGLPRVANRRIETLSSRLQELSQLGIRPSVLTLCRSTREYQQYINKWKKRHSKLKESS